MRSSGMNIIFSAAEEYELDQQMNAVIQQLAVYAERAKVLRGNSDVLTAPALLELKNNISSSLETIKRLRESFTNSRHYATRCRQLAACYRGLSVLYCANNDEKNMLQFASMAINALHQIANNNKSKEDYVNIADIYGFLALALKHHPHTYQPLFTLAHDYFSAERKLGDQEPTLMKLEALSTLIGNMKKNADHNHMLLQFLRLLPDMQLEADHGYHALYPKSYLKSQLTEKNSAQYQQNFQELKTRHTFIEECYRTVEEQTRRSLRAEVPAEPPAPSRAPQRPVPAAPKRPMPPPPAAVLTPPPSLVTPPTSITTEARAAAPQPAHAPITHHIRDQAVAHPTPAPVKTAPASVMYKAHIKPEDAARQSYAGEMVARLKKK